MTVRAATRDQIEKIARAEYDEDIDRNTSKGIAGIAEGGEGGGAAYKGFQFVHSRFSEVKVTRSTEARLLACVTRAVDEALEANGTLGVEEDG